MVVREFNFVKDFMVFFCVCELDYVVFSVCLYNGCCWCVVIFELVLECGEIWFVMEFVDKESESVVCEFWVDWRFFVKEVLVFVLIFDS